jgi:putative transcriptional regulator
MINFDLEKYFRRQNVSLQDIFAFYMTFRSLKSTANMIRCHLSRLMGECKMNIADVARETGLNRNTITLLYRETATRVELDTIDKLCKLFNCKVGDLLERE